MGIITDVLSTMLLILYSLVGQNVVLAIIAFTVIVRLSIMPLTIKQQRSMKRMQELSPKLKQLQQKYKDDREKLTQEQMKLYREHGVNPFAGCLPLIIQLPILFGLWRAIIATLASSPRQLLELQDRILVPGLDHLVPLQNTFLWLNLAVPDPYYVLPVLVVITTYIQQKLIMPVRSTEKKPRKPNTPPDPTEQAEQITRSMTTIMPIMFGVFALSYSSGLSIYFITANIFGILQYAAMGKADIRRLIGKESPKPAEALAPEIDIPISDDSNKVSESKPATLETPMIEAVATAAPSHRQLKPGITMKTLKPASTSRSAKSSSKSKTGASQKSRSNQKSRSKR